MIEYAVDLPWDVLVKYCGFMVSGEHFENLKTNMICKNVQVCAGNILANNFS